MFLAHNSLLDNAEYHILNQYNKKKVLVNNNGVYSISSNICPHQKSIISIKDGAGMRTCPYHNWSFSADGSPISSGRTGHYCKNSIPLQSEAVYDWNSLLFSTPVNFNIDVDFSTMTLVETRTDTVNSNYKNVMDLFLDVDHIPTVHRGVYDRIGITDTNVKWDYYDCGSVQTVEQGAFWIAVYPYTMIEWQKGSMFITTALPVNDELTTVYVHKYCDPLHQTEWTINEEVWETAWNQDRRQAELITEFSQSNLEPQKLHYREYLHKHGIN